MKTASVKKKVIRLPGIVADARALGVNRVTLYRVLTGEFRRLAGLRRRYDALKTPSKPKPKTRQPK